jgi:glutamate synthase domain-containing protein 3
MMSGMVKVKGFASECAGASAHGGLVVIEGSASSRCGISMKGVDIVVGEDVGHMSAFMAQAGNLVICGNAGASLGDSLYEAVLYVRGAIHSLGADAREEPMAENDYRTVDELLGKAGINYSSKEFKRVASARTLYHWNAEAGQEY